MKAWEVKFFTYIHAFIFFFVRAAWGAQIRILYETTHNEWNLEYHSRLNEAGNKIGIKRSETVYQTSFPITDAYEIWRNNIEDDARQFKKRWLRYRTHAVHVAADNDDSDDNDVSVRQ